MFAGACVVALGRRRVELDQLELSVAVRGLHHRRVDQDALEPDDAVHPPALDRCLALQLESELDEELSRGREVVDHDADVVHPLDRQLFAATRARSATRSAISPMIRLISKSFGV